MQCTSFPRGSEWRKWDLHLHTPSSYDYKQKSASNSEIINTLVKNEISVAAITDHHIMDCDRISDLKRLASNKVTILPGIELRTNSGGSENVHLIGIFPEDSNYDNIWAKISGKLDITTEDVKEKGNDYVFVDLVTACEIIHKLGGVTTIHAGGKSNSIENLDNKVKVFQRVKKEYLTKHIDFLELSKTNDVHGYQEIVFPNIQKTLPFISGSDNHNILNYSFNTECWIKSDPTFLGLKQVITEPSRALLGDQPPYAKYPSINGHRYLDVITLSSTTSNPSEKFFDQELPINNSLTTIIGRKGSGKSALADVIALLGASGDYDDFIFLNKKSFRKAPESLSKKHSAKLSWRNQIVDQVTNLHSNPEDSLPQKVKYLPQLFLEKICTQLSNKSQKTYFDEQIEDIVFKNITAAKRKDELTLEQYIENRTAGTEEKISAFKAELQTINNRLVEIEHKISTSTMTANLNELNLLKEQLKQLISQKPVQPTYHSQKNAQQQKIITKKTTILEKISKCKTAIKKKRSTYELRQQSIQIAIEKAQTYQKEFSRKIDELNTQLATEGINVKIKQNLTLDLNDLEKHNKKDLKREKAFSRILSADSKLSKIESDIIAEVIALKKTLSKEQQAVLQYKIDIQKWKKQLRKLAGTTSSPNTLAYYKRSIREVPTLRTQHTSLVKKRNSIFKKTLSLKNKVKKTYVESFFNTEKKILDFKNNLEVKNENIPVSFSIEISVKKLADELLRITNKKHAGFFRIAEEAEKKIQQFIEENPITSTLDAYDFVLKLESEIYKDIELADRYLHTENILAVGQDSTIMHQVLFNPDNIVPSISMNWDHKNIKDLSPGERGTLLLLFFLIADPSECPLIIDQPEDNLDNDTIFSILVPCIKEAKKRRQLILVTHNPNIAVACDAEQIIHAQKSLTPPFFQYQSGAIESPAINKMIVDTLEGTLPAFKYRERTYLK